MVTIVAGGQYGSEGKGAVAARLHEEHRYAAAVRVGGPNAGHTVVDKQGYAYALRQLPVAAVADENCELVIAAGSEIDLKVLEGEIRLVEAHGFSVVDRLLIDATATVITGENYSAEQGGSFGENGSTRKGIGAARAARAVRQAILVEDHENTNITDDVAIGELLGDAAASLRLHDKRHGDVLVEGTQGYGLGTHAGYYPYCTSGDCRAVDFLAQAGLPPRDVDTWLVLRTYPIRIAGDSGPLKGEISWERIGVPPEFTTVTKKERRVGVWDRVLARDAVDANGGWPHVKVALTFVDYWWPELAGATDLAQIPKELVASLQLLQQEIDSKIYMLGTGPNTQILTEGGF